MIAPLPLGDYEEEEDEEISPDLWQEACWIVIRWALIRVALYSAPYRAFLCTPQLLLR